MLTTLGKLALLAVAALPLAAQPSGEELARTLATLDAALFDSYNKCDLEKNRTFFAEDVEFYHDQSGLMVGADKLIAALKQNICGKVRRELVPGSLEAHVLKGYGAVQIGVHRFYNPPDSPKPGGEAKFIHVWRYQDGTWKITHVISYDHAAIRR